MTVVSKNIYFDVLDDIVNKYNNTAHKTITTKPVYVTSDSYAKYNEQGRTVGGRGLLGAEDPPSPAFCLVMPF